MLKPTASYDEELVIASVYTKAASRQPQDSDVVTVAQWCHGSWQHH